MANPQVADFISSRRNWEEDAGRIECPALLVTGDVERGALVAPETAKRLAEMNTMIRTMRIPGAGHNIRRERFDAFLTEFRRFVKE